MKVDIRTMTVDDLPAVAKLTAELGYADEAAGVSERFPALAGDPDHGLFVAVDGDVVGFIHVHARRMLHDRAAAQVQAMAVSKSRRRRGIGTLLLARAEVWAAARGLAAVTLYSADGRDGANGFYAVAGYRRKVGINRYDKPLIAADKRRKA